MERYTTLKVLAPALYGDVLLCKDNITGDKVAVKRMKLSAARSQTMINDTRKIMEDVVFEKHVNQVLSADGGHQHILRMRADFIENGYEHFVLDYAPNGELFDVVDASDKLSNETALRYFRQILSGVRYMHLRGFAHRDLSLENVLLDEHNNAKVCDFGLAASIPSLRTEGVGKAFYMAPEVVAQLTYDPAKADVWSLGIMLFIMLSGIPLVEMASQADSRFRILKAKGLRRLVQMWKMTSAFEPLALELLERMLDPNAETRITLDQVLAHPYVHDPAVEAATAMLASIKVSSNAKLSRTTSTASTASSTSSTTSPCKVKGLAYTVMDCLRSMSRRPSSRKIVAAPTQSLVSIATN
ncbi:hypothetical protein LEN26_003719 [Aphanomyces euteiches]|nr:hypothetical protein AeMF1_002554 [Aphanomyces euteiches]KAH9152363.1 hypothetical protein LEN26_003719 [Aphanomyces euteiches]KAH9192091.1 hypothetical protein AeNC1_005932 [Aphanomyces euteiches]